MTISTHIYSAVIHGTSDELSVKGGSITFDVGRSPHVTASLTIARPDEEVLELLDPREGTRIVVTADATFPTGTQTRTFNLGIRDQATSHGDGTVSLPLASDEALALDYAPLADDFAPYSYQDSLVNVVNYALGKAITGAALESGQPNPPIRALIDSTNLILDPGTNASGGGGFIPANASLDTNDTSWSISGDGDSFNIFSPSTADSNLAIQTTSGVFPGVSAGRWYVLSATGNVKVALSGTSVTGDLDAGTGTTLPRQRALVVFTKVGSAPYQMWHSGQVPNTINTPTRVFVKFYVPEGATEVFMRAYLGTTAGQIRWDGFRLSEATDDPTDTGYWDGDTTDTTEYAYAWTGTQDISTSTRTALVDRADDLLTWRAGVSALDFILPIVQASGLRLVCDEERNWTLRSEEYTEPGALSLRYGVNITSADETISRDSGLWFDAAVRRYRWRDSDGNQQERVDAYALTTPYTRLHTLDIDAPYPGPGRAEYAVRRAQQRGREVSVSAVSDWTASAEQNVTVLLPDAPIQVGSIQSLTFDLDTDEMTITTRTMEVGVGAIDLLTGTINALAGTINSL